MTNEEKARELFKTEVGNLDVPDFDREFEIFTAIEAMADWKDKQFKKAVAQLRKWLYEHGKLDKLDLVEFDMLASKLMEDKK